MKALTLTQPWATLVAIGAKKVETRSWHTNYRGPLAIHAAKTFPIEAKRLCLIPSNISIVLRVALGTCNSKRLPIGKVIATCELVDCIRMTSDNLPPEPELLFGDYRPGRWMWLLSNVMPIEPVPAIGHLGLWEWITAGNGD